MKTHDQLVKEMMERPGVRAEVGQMTREDIIRMARDTCSQAPREDWESTVWAFGIEGLESFAALVAAAERNRTWTQAHWTEYERSIAAAEREACAKVADEIAANYNNPTASECATTIRAMGNK